MAQEELELKAPIPTPIPPTFLGGGGAVSGCGCLVKKDTLRRHPRPTSLSSQTGVRPAGFPEEVSGPRSAGGLQAGARGQATPSRIPVTAEIAEIGCN